MIEAEIGWREGDGCWREKSAAAAGRPPRPGPRQIEAIGVEGELDGPQVMQIVRRAEQEGELSWGENPGSRRVPLVSSLASLGSYKRIVAA